MSGQTKKKSTNLLRIIYKYTFLHSFVMAFEYLSSQVNLFNLIFNQILKISPTILSSYANIQDQVLYLILIPHVILFLFLYAFSFGIVMRITGSFLHRGFIYLVGIVSYIYIMYSGWYGRLVMFFLGWMNIALGLALFLFLASIIWHPSATTAGMKLVGEAGKELAKKTAKSHEKRAIEEEVDAIGRELSAINAQLSNPGLEPQARAYMQMQKANLEAQKRRLESRL